METTIYKEFEKDNIQFSTDINLKEITYLKTGGTVHLIVYPKNSNELVSVLAKLDKHKITFKVIGATSNLLFLDNVVYTCLVSTKQMCEMYYNKESGELICGSGVMLPDFTRFALYNSISGFEGLEGIPGTMGGAVFMNAGAYGYAIKDFLKAVDVVTDGEVVQYTIRQLQLTHRNSIFRTGETKGVIVRCYFNATKGENNLISSNMELFHSKRHKYQDFLYPNLGSIFSGSLYRSICKRDIYCNWYFKIYYLFQYKFKIFTRESPLNRKRMNDIIVKRFSLNYEKQPFSDKTINCLVNRGQGTDEMIKYINDMQSIIDGEIRLENEILKQF